MRFAVSLVVGTVVALLLFLLMHGLVSGRDGLKRSRGSKQLVEFVRVREEEVVNVKNRSVPEQPPPPTRPPPPPRMNVPRQDDPPPMRLDIDMPDIRVAPLAGSPYIGQYSLGDPVSEGDIVPIVRMQPQYPREALMNGTQGWVEVEFTISDDGSVRDAEVVASDPPRIFDREALRAILRWKFKPRVVGGVAVDRRARQVVEFQLDRGR